MTSSHDARQDWQASVLRDLTPPENSPAPETRQDAAEFDDSMATKIVNPADLGIAFSAPAPVAAEPTPAALSQEPTQPEAPAYPQPSQFPAAPQPYAGYPTPGYPQPTPTPSAAPQQAAPPPQQTPAPQQAAAPQPVYPQATAFPQNPAYGQPQPYAPPPQPQYPAPQQHPAQTYGAPPAVAFPAPQRPMPMPQTPAQQLGHELQPTPSRVFGPDATPVHQEWTPDGLLDMPTHADNWHQRLRSSVRGVGGSAAKASREAAEIARELTAPVTTGRRVAVLGIRGGSGKSTVASLLVSAYSTHRGDRVLAVDADPDLGSLGLRLGASSPTSLAGLGKVPRVWQTLDEAERCLGRTQSGAWILSGERNIATPETVTPNAYLGVLHGISRYFAVTVVDAGAGMVTQLNQAVLADAHAIVLATPASIDGVVSARRALEWIAEWGANRLPQTVVALTAMSPQATDIDLGRTTEALAPFGVVPALLPYDRHLATGATIEPWRLGERTRNAAVQLSAAVLSRARMV